jgi:hypothetical protein
VHSLNFNEILTAAASPRSEASRIRILLDFCKKYCISGEIHVPFGVPESQEWQNKGMAILGPNF